MKSEEFGEFRFGPGVMEQRLPKPVYDRYLAAMKNQSSISLELADAIAHAMKVWAIDHGATHYCHFFQPLNGKTAEKHDAFLQKGPDGYPILRLSGKALVKGETDGSSFPTGGLRDTFEARGYTFWDTSSYAYVRDKVLYIPSVFVGYNGEKLDLKLPLLKAKEALSKMSTRLLHLLGRNNVKYVEPMLGLEQEYFLVNKKEAEKRPDFLYCGKSLYGADMPKAGDYEDTYFASIDTSVKEFMNEVNETCWKLGIYASNEHGEVAPGQYEFCAEFDDAVTSIDQNLLVMDILKSVAGKHGFRCLLDEKPFADMNGSGKHNNFSLVSSEGDNLFEPGTDNDDNLTFILFITAFISAVDKHQTLLRMACSEEGNDYRLGADEAPPAIVSIYLGESLSNLFKELVEESEISPLQLSTMVSPLVSLTKMAVEATDRNRTSPVAFVGNKFEIRMLGSSLNPSSLNTFLYGALAQSLEEIGDLLEGEGCENPSDLHKNVLTICRDILIRHGKVLFEGDGYSGDWHKEARKRGLEEFPSYIDSVDVLLRKETLEMVEHFDILNETELKARRDVLVKRYIHAVKIKARVLTRMAQEGIYPALLEYQKLLQDTLSGGMAKSVGTRAEKNARFLDMIDKMTYEMTESINEIIKNADIDKVAEDMTKTVRPDMLKLSALLNEAELNSPYKFWPYPTTDKLIVQ